MIITVIIMKKFFIVIVSIIVCFSLCSCANALEKRVGSISELRDELMVCESETGKVTLISGRRENPFVVDGKRGETVDFTVVTFYPNSANETDRFYYTFNYDGVNREGEFSKHPFKNTYSFEIDYRIRGGASILVKGDNGEQSFELRSVITEKVIGAEHALEKAELRLAEHIKKFTSGGKLNAEIYVRFLENPISSQGGYYWYIAFVPDKYSVYATLIHPETGDIVATREG